MPDVETQGINSVVQALDRLAASLQKGPWDHVYIVIVLLTLLVLIWYTVETQRLRKAGQDQTAKDGAIADRGSASERRVGAPPSRSATAE
jgi:hypothetical protein